MKILGYEISVNKIGGPLGGLRQKDVDKLAVKFTGFSDGGVSRKIARIKAVRTLRPGTGLKDAKDWVDEHTED